MIFSLLHIVVPTILISVILILYINSSKKQVIEEIRELKTQLEKLDNVTVPETEPAEAHHEDEAEISEQIRVQEKTDKEEKQDEPAEVSEPVGASAYNTGKSGKIYTKEELELLIKE